jgi:hypothetical protein
VYNPEASPQVVIAEFLAHTSSAFFLKGGCVFVIFSALQKLFAMPQEDFGRPEAHCAVRWGTVDESSDLYTRVTRPEVGVIERASELSEIAANFLVNYGTSGLPPAQCPAQEMQMNLKLRDYCPYISMPPLTAPNHYFAAAATAFVEHTIRAIHNLMDARPCKAHLRQELLDAFQDIGPRYLDYATEQDMHGKHPALALGNFMRANGIYYHLN